MVDHFTIKRALYILSVALITAGIVIAADVAMTLAWREPLSTGYGSIQQGHAADELEQLQREYPTPAELHDTASNSRDVETQARKLADTFPHRVETAKGI